MREDLVREHYGKTQLPYSITDRVIVGEIFTERFEAAHTRKRVAGQGNGRTETRVSQTESAPNQHAGQKVKIDRHPSETRRETAHRSAAIQPRDEADVGLLKGRHGLRHVVGAHG